MRRRKVSKSEYDPRLCCGVLRLTYDFATKRGDIYFPTMHCCDMSGCIKLFQAIDEAVASIQTWSGKERDTAYKCDANSGEWSALCYVQRQGQR